MGRDRLEERQLLCTGEEGVPVLGRAMPAGKGNDRGGGSCCWGLWGCGC